MSCVHYAIILIACTVCRHREWNHVHDVWEQFIIIILGQSHPYSRVNIGVVGYTLRGHQYELHIVWFLRIHFNSIELVSRQWYM